jgi:hypothetical protein
VRRQRRVLFLLCVRVHEVFIFIPLIIAVVFVGLCVCARGARVGVWACCVYVCVHVRSGPMCVRLLLGSCAVSVCGVCARVGEGVGRIHEVSE